MCSQNFLSLRILLFFMHIKIFKIFRLIVIYIKGRPTPVLTFKSTTVNIILGTYIVYNYTYYLINNTTFVMFLLKIDTKYLPLIIRKIIYWYVSCTYIPMCYVPFSAQYCSSNAIIQQVVDCILCSALHRLISLLL